MTAVLRMITAIWIASASVVVARSEGTDAFLLADEAIRKHEGGQKGEAEEAFRKFQMKWDQTTNAYFFNKALYIKAAECFLVFGQATKATALLRRAIDTAGRSLPPEAPYLLVKSLAVSGDHRAAVEVLEKYAVHVRDLPLRQRQELAIMGARAAVQIDERERAKVFLRDAVRMGPESDIGRAAREELRRLEVVQESGDRRDARGGVREERGSP